MGLREIADWALSQNSLISLGLVQGWGHDQPSPFGEWSVLQSIWLWEEDGLGQMLKPTSLASPSAKDEVEVAFLYLMSEAHYGLFGPWEEDGLSQKPKPTSSTSVSTKAEVEANPRNLINRECQMHVLAHLA